MAGISGAGRSELTLITGRGRRLLTVDDVVAALQTDRVTAAKKLARWTNQGWLRRVKRSLYLPVPVDAENPAAWSDDPLVLADAVWSPCYFTGWTAANHLGLSEQTFRTTVVRTVRQVRSAKARLLEHDYLIAHVQERDMSWGLVPLWREDRRLLVADPARTVIDSLDNPRLSGGIRNGAEILNAYLDDHDPVQLVEYGDRLGNATVFKRLGYLVVTMHRDNATLVAECRRRLSSGISLLDPTGSPAGERVSEWGLRVNAHITELGPS